MKKFFISLFLVLGVLMVPGSVSATTFDLIGPSSDPVRGQDVIFTININTEGKSLSSTSIGMTYDTQFLEYVSVAPGNTFTTISADVEGTGRLIISGSSTTSYSGTGVFAYVTLKLIATGPGATQLCALYNPTETPTATPIPTSPPGQPTYTPAPPPPTALPTSGETNSTSQGIILASFFLIAAAGGFLVFKKT